MDEEADVDIVGDQQGDAPAEVANAALHHDDEPQEDDDDDPELEALKRKVKQMQEEAEALEKIQAQVEQSVPGSIRKPGANESAAAKNDKDMRSVYVGNVDYGTAPEELQAHFASCGTIDRITILCDKWTGKPKGYAYVMFVKPESVANALLLNETTFRGRPLKVTSKRTNLPSAPPGGGGFRGRGGRGGGGYGGYGPRRGGGGRGRGRRGFSPY